MAGWLAKSKLKSREDLAAGLATFPDTPRKLYKGANFGKLILQVAES